VNVQVLLDDLASKDPCLSLNCKPEMAHNCYQNYWLSYLSFNASKQTWKEYIVVAWHISWRGCGN